DAVDDTRVRRERHGRLPEHLQVASIRAYVDGRSVQRASERRVESGLALRPGHERSDDRTEAWQLAGNAAAETATRQRKRALSLYDVRIECRPQLADSHPRRRGVERKAS